MSNLCVVTSRHLIPAIKTAHQAIDKAKTNPKIICALNRTLETLKVAEFQMQRTQTDNAESGQPGCLFFETALLNTTLAKDFILNQTVTPYNKEDLLKQIKAAYEHLEKCANR
ncbi:MAG: hypothetical protein CMF60_01590 [Magnetococcales bacterium]|nr:hypothetical protein [Magnetococcales bacterium]MEC8067325.1 hypothetical protein [Pseudomonadota bacterium]|tara:strand:- start:248 stop:586 length:339 start_codon:yes stop_codon:yes gene_type:complete